MNVNISAISLITNSFIPTKSLRLFLSHPIGSLSRYHLQVPLISDPIMHLQQTGGSIAGQITKRQFREPRTQQLYLGARRAQWWLFKTLRLLERVVNVDKLRALLKIIPHFPWL